MSNIESKGVHHIDGTHRITIYGFPLIVDLKTKELADTLKEKRFKKFKNNRVTYEGTFKGHTFKYVLTFKDNRYANVCSCDCKYF